MTRIITNVQSLVAQRVLGAQNKALNESLTRLSTGLRINSGKDDPAGLIASESLRSEKRAISAAIDNANRADNVLSIAEGALQEVSSLLLELEDLVDRSASEAGLSSAEVKANQAQIDNVLASIDRISNTSEFNGKKLLTGNLDFTTSSVSTTNITDVSINSAKVPNGGFRSVTVDVVTGSTFASVSGVGGDTGGNNALSAATTLEIRGEIGTEVVSFASGTTLASIETAINQSTALTGVSATVSGGNGIVFASTGYGADAVVSVEVLSGRFAVDGTDTATNHSSTSNGTNGTVLISGATANVDGLEVSARAGALSIDMVLGATFGSTDAGNTSFEITGGGAVFSIAPEVNLVGRETIGIRSVSTGSLGNVGTGFLSSIRSGGANDLNSGNLVTAQRVLREAQDQVSTLRGRIGGFQSNTLNTTVNSLLVALENVSAAESAIRDTDFAEQTSALTRSQILVNTATATLQLANAQPQAVLSLLG